MKKALKDLQKWTDERKKKNAALEREIEQLDSRIINLRRKKAKKNELTRISRQNA